MTGHSPGPGKRDIWSSVKEHYKDRNVLVIGGTGSIGSEIVRQLLPLAPKAVRVLSRDDSKQHELEQELGDRPDVRYLIGDVQDLNRLKRAMRGIHYVFNAAGLKHVPACEYNPFEAVQTNVIGTQNVIQAAIDTGVGHVVAVSTDKAVNPRNTMGATKLLAEKVVAAAQRFAPEVRLSSVRFGNVLGSRGSLVPLVEKQIRKGGPVTLTDPEMTRFFMSIPRAAWLVLAAGVRAQGGDTFILRMPALKVRELIDVLIQELAPRAGRRAADVQVETIGIRPGEHLHEALLTDDEAERVEVDREMFVVRPRKGPTTTRCAPEEYRSDCAPHLTRPEIVAMLRDAGAL